jgi:hypothetical protein
VLVDRTEPEQPLLGFAEVGPDREVWEYAGLVTSLGDEILTLGPRPNRGCRPRPQAGPTRRRDYHQGFERGSCRLCLSSPTILARGAIARLATS